MIQLARYSKHHNERFSWVPVAKILDSKTSFPSKYLCNVLLIRLLKIRRQPTTGFTLPLGAHQVGPVPEFPSTLCST
ncbi:hypothetical protein T265_08439 [Opisthorchis viverrini]|uniref:Uncharacterized protein n=1 Tax=Opisthorchis viverrini TaxID=6198 RepID=A0A074ZK69_OPIVI|nr:hypothetical protein T265_08439 [Opisthorchis viverrini]KER23750.1 hypothetical protein T265_08439 [Opisthorchis viverrini]